MIFYILFENMGNVFFLFSEARVLNNEWVFYHLQYEDIFRGHNLGRS